MCELVVTHTNTFPGSLLTFSLQLVHSSKVHSASPSRSRTNMVPSSFSLSLFLFFIPSISQFLLIVFLGN
ncbi:hypothetical protein RchiOBHm_Chr1g0372611 [Rosa chinensis]|uniref:Uncharacterized protein n=1 Tax=Rosa chinensis TaxID=74649 RepID=A0A2P6SLT8_ROSCH|nr:hypothetical protein RchiOBHm_Chr1g0372611 [Rosa chinensis]